MSIKASPEKIEQELHFLCRHLDRLEEGFQLEKDAALQEGLEGLAAFRDRCRAHYQVDVGRVRMRLRQLLHMVARSGIATPEMDGLLTDLERTCRESLARYAGTPNRLIRMAKNTTKERT